jgi:hypothetical protein
MAMFVHLTAEKNVKLILRNGVTRFSKVQNMRGIFAMPVTRNFYVSHQWLRELKRLGKGMVAGVYFRIPDADLVRVGHYNQAHQTMTAAEAVAMMSRQDSQEGYQVIIPRRIKANEIHRVKSLPQVVGWRYQPGAHGEKPCPCPICLRGSYGARRIREKYDLF